MKLSNGKRKLLAAVAAVFGLMACQSSFAVTYCYDDNHNITMYVTTTSNFDTYYSIYNFLQGFSLRSKINGTATGTIHHWGWGPLEKIQADIPYYSNSNSGYTSYYNDRGNSFSHSDLRSNVFNIANTDNADRSPVINGINLPLRLWTGHNTTGDRQFINIINNNNWYTTCDIEDKTEAISPFAGVRVRIDGGGIDTPSTRDIYFTIDNFNPYFPVLSPGYDRNKKVLDYSPQDWRNMLTAASNEIKQKNISSSDWMGNISSAISSKPLKKLVLLGSHDSGTYSIDTAFFNKYLNRVCQGQYNNNDSGAKAAAILYSPYWFTGYLDPNVAILGDTGKRIVAALARAQNRNIYDQLNLGVRFLDLRVSYEADGNFYAPHALLGANYYEILPQIKNFIEHHPSEIVVIEFTHFFDANDVNGNIWDVHTKKFFDMVVDQLGPMIYQPADNQNLLPGDLTYGEIRKKGKNIVLLSDNNYSTNQFKDYLFPLSDRTFRSYYDERNDSGGAARLLTDGMMDNYFNYQKNGFDGIRVAQGVMCPNTVSSYAKAGFSPDELYDNGIDVDRQIYNNLQNQMPYGMMYPGVILVDSIDNGEWTSNLMQLVYVANSYYSF